MIALEKIDVYFTTSEIYSNQPKVGQGLTEWALVSLGPNVIYKSK